MEQYWIIGFGNVGRRALSRLRRKSPDADITIVDPRYSIPPEKIGAVQWHVEDGVAFLLKSKVTGNDGNAPWIVPALPHHLAYEWIAVRLKETGLFKPCAVPGNVITQLPNTVIGPEGQAYISNADFICPENCNEPQKGCPITGKPGPYRLHEYLSQCPTGRLSIAGRSKFSAGTRCRRVSWESANRGTGRGAGASRKIPVQHRQSMSRRDACL